MYYPPILMVEGDLLDAQNAIRALGNMRNRFVVKDSGEDALQWLSDTARMPVLMLIAMNLPDMHGAALLSCVRANHRTSLVHPRRIDACLRRTTTSWRPARS